MSILEPEPKVPTEVEAFIELLLDRLRYIDVSRWVLASLSAGCPPDHNMYNIPLPHLARLHRVDSIEFKSFETCIYFWPNGVIAIRRRPKVIKKFLLTDTDSVNLVAKEVLAGAFE